MFCIPKENFDKVINKFSFDKPAAGPFHAFGLFILVPFVACFDKCVEE